MHYEQEIEMKMSEGLEQAIKGFAANSFKKAYNADLEDFLMAKQNEDRTKAEIERLKTEKSKSDKRLKSQKAKLKLAKAKLKLVKARLNVEKSKSDAWLKLEKAKLKAEKTKSDATIKKLIAFLDEIGFTITEISENTDIKIQEIEQILKSEKLI